MHMTEPMTEHTVIISMVGGATVLSCEGLGIKNIEHPYSPITTESIKKTILNYKYLKEADAIFDLVIMDNREEPVNYNEQREKESREFKYAQNSMRVPR